MILHTFLVECGRNMLQLVIILAHCHSWGEPDTSGLCLYHKRRSISTHKLQVFYEYKYLLKSIAIVLSTHTNISTNEYSMNISTHQPITSLWVEFHQRLNLDSSRLL